jgi:hypothetical protein
MGRTTFVLLRRQRRPPVYPMDHFAFVVDREVGAASLFPADLDGAIDEFMILGGALGASPTWRCSLPDSQ